MHFLAILDYSRPCDLASEVDGEAMVPLSQTPPVDLTGKPILIVSGTRDPIMPPERAAQLASLLERSGALVEHRTLPAGHELSQADVALARTWLQAHARPETHPDRS